jgi:4-amino-4-deoxy-L-arabinose transferase-like glycosyltransferase
MRGALALLVSFAVPILAYSTFWYFHAGRFQLSDEGSILGRLAASANCATLVLPADERPICPTHREQARGIDWLEHKHGSPLKHFPVPAGKTRADLLAGFESAVESQQAVRVVGGILGDSLKLFEPTKSALPGVTPISRWQFQTTYPKYRPEINVKTNGQIVVGIQEVVTHPFRFQLLTPAYGGRAQVNRPIAGFLRAYQLDGGYAPGPLLAIFALAGLGGSAIAFGGRRTAGRRGGEAREREVSLLALGCLLFFSSAVGVLLVSDMFEFSWRYQLPALVTLPPAGVMGIWAARRLLARRQAPAAEAAPVTVPAAAPSQV